MKCGIMIRLLKVTYLEGADEMSSKVNEYLNGILDTEDFPSHTGIGIVLAAAADMKEYSWEPYKRDCIYIITQEKTWNLFEDGLLKKVGVQYQVEDVLDEYYSGKIKLPKLRRKIQKYLRFWLTCDDVLDKISKHGMSSLTTLDYKILRDESEKS
jgi:hypothetical protein